MTSFSMARRNIVFTAPYPMQATVNPCLHWRLQDTPRQVWLSLLWGHCSFLLGPTMHKVFFLPSKSLFPQSLRSSIIKSHWPSKSHSVGSQSLCQIPRLGNLLWALELSPECKKFFDIIVLQFVLMSNYHHQMPVVYVYIMKMEVLYYCSSFIPKFFDR